MNVKPADKCQKLKGVDRYVDMTFFRRAFIYYV